MNVQIQTHRHDLALHLAYPGEHVRMKRVGYHKFGHGIIDDTVELLSALQYQLESCIIAPP